jgi:hypothetical protein
MNWKRIEQEFERIDNATYGLAEFVVVGGVGVPLVIGLYCVLYATFYGCLQLFTLATGAF